jgi:hypothetical protein
LFVKVFPDFRAVQQFDAMLLEFIKAVDRFFCVIGVWIAVPYQFVVEMGRTELARATIKIRFAELSGGFSFGLFAPGWRGSPTFPLDSI